jgi:hypothetical protein
MTDNTHRRIFNLANTTVEDMNGRRVRIITGYAGYSQETMDLIIGQEGTCTYPRPDSDGDIYVQFDRPLEGGRTYAYARSWVFLDGPEAEMVEDLVIAETVVVKTDAEERLEALIDAIYDTAQSRGYTDLLRDLFDRAGIPLRASNRTITFKGQRVVSMDRYAMNEALATLRRDGVPDDVVVTTSRAIAEFEAKIPFPGEHAEGESCYDLANALSQDNWAKIPDEILTTLAQAIGVAGNVTTMRSWLTNMVTISGGYAPRVTCAFC